MNYFIDVVLQEAIFGCAYRHPMKISKNVPAIYDCACKIEVIAVMIGKIKTIFIMMKLELIST